VHCVDAKGVDAIRSQYHGDFLRRQWADAAFMTAAGMAEATGLPTTTLVRLLACLGYPGFRSFRDAVRTQLREGARRD